MTTEKAAANGTGKPPPTSEDVARTLRARIESGALEEGRSLPTQMALVAEFGVKRGVIRQALRRLQDDGLLTEVTRGAPPRIAARSAARRVESAADERPQETMVALRPRITAAFEAGHVRIDALCLTAESLTAAIGEQRLRVQDRSVTPDGVRVRVLLPNRDIDLAFPRSVGTEDTHPEEGDLVHRRWLQQRNAHGTVLRDHLTGMRNQGVDVEVEFRALPFTPPVKLYLLNNSEALFAFYTVAMREVEIGHRSVEMHDVLGDKSPLFSFEADETRVHRDKAFVTEAQAWFDALWETIATPLALESAPG
ncbi:GntR family transcriptional regulator [Streptomyces sp. NPDC087420]|uniref:GntR family transcriptional regulator n=1 Tax=Streptomyces sp. NPDC087420 TaxID=3365785 RepID=UPI0038382AB1